MNYKLIYIILISLCSKGYSQNYAATDIPDSLKLNANAIIRLDEMYIEIKDIDKAIIHHKYAYTILNEKADELASYGNYYDKFHSVNDISGKLFDAAGNKKQSIKKSDIHDIIASDGFSLITDARIKFFSFYNKSYPYTVEFEDEVSMNGIFNLPKWMPIKNENIALQKSTLIVETPDDYSLRYKQLNFSFVPEIESAKRIKYQWNMTNKKAIVSEKYMPDLDELLPVVFLGQSKFSFGGYKGEMTSWKGFGKFIFDLVDGRDELPKSTKKEIHQLTDALSTIEEKVNILYKYLQENTRYVSIQLGIGGYQPFEAKYVAEKKYGDCKALSNFMVSMLKEIGIKANHVIIFAGVKSDNVIADFPQNYFNHMVACVPNKQDTIWLECTSQSESVGYMGLNTGNRKAVLVTDTGGVLVQTPVYYSKDNLQIRKINATIDNEGNLSMNVFTHFTGISQEYEHHLLHNKTPEDRIKLLNESFSLPTYAVNKADYKETKGRIPIIDEDLSITAPNYASVSGKRLFISPNILNKRTPLTKDTVRKFPIVFPFAFKDMDTILIQIPNGYFVESLPKSVHLKSKFGDYSITFSFEKNMIKTLRIHERSATKFSAAEYNDIVQFYDDISRADHSKLVLVKQE